jgi:23S rRNA pseudouridine955/2504/2580 synthase
MSDLNYQKVTHHEAEANDDGQRIDNYLIKNLKGVPRSKIYKILRKGEVRVNKGRVKPTYRIRAGDMIRIPPLRVKPEGERTNAPTNLIARLEASIIYEDKELLVLNKPSGIAVHGGSGISHGVIEAFRESRPTQTGLELAHRLDRDTSGCLMMAKRRSALRRLQQLQREGRIEKHYLALLAGRWRKGARRVSVPLKKNTLKSGERVVRVDAEGKEALTLYKVVEKYEQATLVDADLRTGRTHQIRVHAQYLGTPILGDQKYGDDGLNHAFKKYGLNRLFLHAASLKFPWGENAAPIKLEAPLSERLISVLSQLEEERDKANV